MSVLTFSAGAKPATESLTIQGIAFTMAMTLAPTAAGYLGMTEDQLVSGISAVGQAIGFAWAIYGVLRRKDIRLPWQTVSK